MQQGVAVQELVQALEAILHTGSAINFQGLHACLFAVCRMYGDGMQLESTTMAGTALLLCMVGGAADNACQGWSMCNMQDMRSIYGLAFLLVAFSLRRSAFTPSQCSDNAAMLSRSHCRLCCRKASCRCMSRRNSGAAIVRAGMHYTVENFYADQGYAVDSGIPQSGWNPYIGSVLPLQAKA